MATWIKRALGALVVLAIGYGLYTAMRPAPVPVDTVAIGKGELLVTVNEEGKTRIRDVFQVSAPIAGKVLRSPREVGDEVTKGKTLVAEIQPVDPSFLDVRSRRELEAAVEAAQAAVTLSEAEIRKAESQLRFSKSELRRALELRKISVISERAQDEATMNVETSQAALATARANLELRERELESARARLIGPLHSGGKTVSEENCCFELYAPEDGKVLKITTESEQVVASGAPLLEIGDPQNLEIIVELLSSDAVKISPGAPAMIERWGGQDALHAKVRRIDPAGFTKVSALGIEEQRVFAVLDITDPPEKWARLGHDFRVFVRISIWDEDDVLQVPLSALFRSGREWAVFKYVDSTAQKTIVKLGHRNADAAQVVDGLTAGDRVILHPSDRVADDATVVERNSDAPAPAN
ncbi:MAG: efflux RND transporter periplasmic adaptor subunit [Hyphomicrobiales bacterium]